MSEVVVILALGNDPIEVKFDIYAYEYSGPGAERRAGAVFDRMQRSIREASVWRSTTLDRDAWRIMVVAEMDVSNAREFDYGNGVEVELDEQTVEMLLERKLSTAAAAFLRGESHQSERIRFGRGAILRRGGQFELRIGGDQ